MSDPLLRDISDTARWVAVYRARETERPDALFRDPLARRLAGERGEQIAQSIKFARNTLWPWTVRTHLFDQFIMQHVGRPTAAGGSASGGGLSGSEASGGVDVVINLAAGLDARPYRMDLPSSLRWIEIDLPGLIQYKNEALANEKPRCVVERIALDLADAGGRRKVFAELAERAANALILSEGLLIYLSDAEVGALAHDLAAQRGFRNWVIDLSSPGLLKIMDKRVNSPLRQAGMPLKFAPAEGPEFFAKFGWTATEVRSFFKTAAKLKRLPPLLRLLALLPQPDRPTNPDRPWGGVCMLQRR